MSRDRLCSQTAKRPFNIIAQQVIRDSTDFSSGLAFLICCKKETEHFDKTGSSAHEIPAVRIRPEQKHSQGLALLYKCGPPPVPILSLEHRLGDKDDT
jgi:hypothetical protein